MNRDYVVSLLNRNNIDIIEEKRMNNGLGTVIKTVEGCLVNIYDSGKDRIQITCKNFIFNNLSTDMKICGEQVEELLKKGKLIWFRLNLCMLKMKSHMGFIA